MNCPKCGKETMNAEIYEGIEIDRCPTCKGIYLDSGELKGMIEKKMGNIADTLKFSPTSDHMDHITASCPHCNQTMRTIKGPGEVRIDWCKKCDGVFLDEGEFATLQLYFSR